MFRTQREEKPYAVQVSLDGVLTEMEVDVGESLSVISEGTLATVRIGPCFPLRKSTKKLKAYTAEEIPVLVACTFSVFYKNAETRKLDIVVVKRKGPSLLGRDWLKEIQIDWSEIFQLKTSTTEVEELAHTLGEFSEVFEDTRGTVKGTKATILVDSSAKPRYFKPYALREKVKRRRHRLEAGGTIEKVQFSDRAAPIVTVVKPDKSIRICGDYKVTVNSVSKLNKYPIPKTDDLLADLGGGKYFTKLDMTQAYQQLELDEPSKQYKTINTHQGLYRYNRLPHGVSSAPGIFQRTMENILRSIPNVCVRVDDILLAGKTRAEHLKTLRDVL